jgi:tetratricopeptide (TPR) repeat protein
MKEAALEAVRLDPHSAEGYAALGYARMNLDWDWPGAERDLRHAIELNPAAMNPRHWFSHFLTAQGRHEESIAEAEKALTLEPLNMITSEHMGGLTTSRGNTTAPSTTTAACWRWSRRSRWGIYVSATRSNKWGCWIGP